MRKNPLLGLIFLRLGVAIHVVAWIALAVFLYTSETISGGSAVAVGIFGSGVSFVALYFLYKRLVS